MKPYLVQRIEYDALARDVRSAVGAPQVFVLAPSPMAAARKACRDRQVHEGRVFVRLRVKALEDRTALPDSPDRDYRIQMEARVVDCGPA